MGKVGSSTMPQKRNPMCEAILALARLARPLAVTGCHASSTRTRLVKRADGMGLSAGTVQLCTRGDDHDAARPRGLILSIRTTWNAT